MKWNQHLLLHMWTKHLFQPLIPPDQHSSLPILTTSTTSTHRSPICLLDSLKCPPNEIEPTSAPSNVNLALILTAHSAPTNTLIFWSWQHPQLAHISHKLTRFAQMSTTQNWTNIGSFISMWMMHLFQQSSHSRGSTSRRDQLSGYNNRPPTDAYGNTCPRRTHANGSNSQWSFLDWTASSSSQGSPEIAESSLSCYSWTPFSGIISRGISLASSTNNTRELPLAIKPEYSSSQRVAKHRRRLPAQYIHHLHERLYWRNISRRVFSCHINFGKTEDSFHHSTKMSFLLVGCEAPKTSSRSHCSQNHGRIEVARRYHVRRPCIKLTITIGGALASNSPHQHETLCWQPYMHDTFTSP